MSQQHPSTPAPFVLVPPELFSIVTDLSPSPIYRCSSVSPENLTFLKTLSLKTIITLNVETPSKPLRALSEEDGITLRHIGLWQTSTWETFRPLSKGAVERTLQYLAKGHLPVLIVDGGHGTFVGVLRKLMGWGYTGILLEYRSFAGNHARYVNEEFIEMVDTEQIIIPEGIDWLPRRGGVGGKGKGKEEEQKKSEEGRQGREGGLAAAPQGYEGSEELGGGEGGRDDNFGA